VGRARGRRGGARFRASRGVREGDPEAGRRRGDDIADDLGRTIEAVSRTLTKLKKDGLIGLPNYSSVTLADDKALRELAKANVAQWRTVRAARGVALIRGPRPRSRHGRARPGHPRRARDGRALRIVR
jgi:hypothetical protein